MKTILIADQVKGILEAETGFFARKDIQLFTAATTDEVLSVHRAEKLSLIIIGIDMPGMQCEELGCLDQEGHALRAVSLVLLCPADPAVQERASRCNANAVMTLPVTAADLAGTGAAFPECSPEGVVPRSREREHRGKQQRQNILRPFGEYQYHGHAYRNGEGPCAGRPRDVFVLCPGFGNRYGRMERSSGSFRRPRDQSSISMALNFLPLLPRQRRP